MTIADSVGNGALSHGMCRTCGRYHEQKDPPEAFCSRDCAVQYSRCPNCGRYFVRGARGAEDCCSTVCSQQFELVKEGRERYVLVGETV